MITVKVVQYPGEVKEYAVEAGSTVRDILGLAGIVCGAEQAITVNGEEALPATIVNEAGLIAVTKRLKGAC